MKKKIKKIYIQRRKRFLKKIKGTDKKPRLSVFRSHRHIYAQLIDDQTGRTLAYCSTLNTGITGKLNNTATMEAAHTVGKELAKIAVEKQLSHIVFDRGTRPYHGRIASIARGARDGGLQF